MKRLRSFPALLLLSSLLCVLPCFFLDIFYMYGDDYLMNYIANGSFGSTYSAHLIFMQYPAGLALKGLYALLPSVNWYAALLIGTLAVSFAVIHYVLLQNRVHIAGIIFSILVNAAVVPLFLTFTVAAFFSACAGLALVLEGLKKKASYARLIPGVLLMLLSYLIRSNCLLPVCALALPCYAALLLRKEDRMHVLSRLAAAGALLLIGLVVIRASGNAAGSSDDWKSYFAYNEARSAYLDSPEVPYADFAGEFREAGLSEEGWLLLHRWTFCEKDSFSKEKFSSFADIARQAYTKRFRLRYLLDTFAVSPNCYLLILPGLFLLLVLLLPGKKWLRLATCLMLFVILAALTAIRLRFLLRVCVPLAADGIIFLFLSSPSAPELKGMNPARILRLLILAAAGVCLIFFFRGYQGAVASLRSRKTAAGYTKLREEIDKHPERVYIVESPIYVHLFAWGHTIDEINSTDVFSHVIRPGSWDNFSPRYYEIAENTSVRDPDNLLSSLIDGEGIYLVTEDENYVMNFLTVEKGKEISAASVKKRGPARIVRLQSEEAS